MIHFLAVSVLALWIARTSFVECASSFYLVNPSNAYTWSKAFPQSCECAEPSSSDLSCDLFKCTCVCDVTAGVCDYGCCCDPDCSSDQISRFEELDACAFEGSSSSDTITFCYDSSELYGVNPRAPMGGGSAATEGLSRALCVEKKNYVFPSQFYTSDDVQSSSVFGQDVGQKDYSYTAVNTISTADVSVDSFYDQNDTIAAFQSSSQATSGFVSNGPGFFSLPQTDFEGYCNDQNYVGFENSVIESPSCLRRFAVSSSIDFRAQCLHDQSLKRYVTDLYLAKTADIQASSGIPATTSLIPVDLTTVSYFDALSGTVTDITGDFELNSCATQYFADISIAAGFSAAAQPCLFASTAQVSLWQKSNTTRLCAAVVKEVFYTVNHSTSAASNLQSVTAQVVLTDLASSDSDSNDVFLEQRFGVDFFSANIAQRSTENGNLVTRRRSGNPGYQQGAPVLFGKLNGSVIAETVSGLTLPYSITCPTLSTVASLSSVSSAFGYDTITGCTLSLTRSALRDFCCTGAAGSCLANAFAPDAATTSDYVDVASGLAYFLQNASTTVSSFSQSYVGSYGDADPLDITQWQRVTYTVPTDSRVWNDETATCSNVYSGMNLQFLVANSAARANPQQKIVAALAEIVTSDWVFTLPAGDNNSTQTFQLNIVTSFVPLKEENLQDYIPPAPPSLFKLPYDVFYPFVAGGTTSNAASSHQLRGNSHSVVSTVLVLSTLLGAVLFM